MNASQYYTAAGLAAMVFGVVGCAHAAMMAQGSGVARPAAGAFGLRDLVS